jgi:hypothetical protein
MQGMAVVGHALADAVWGEGARATRWDGKGCCSPAEFSRMRLYSRGGRVSDAHCALLNMPRGAQQRNDVASQCLR